MVSFFLLSETKSYFYHRGVAYFFNCFFLKLKEWIKVIWRKVIDFRMTKTEVY